MIEPDRIVDDILHTARTTTSDFDLAINEEMRNEALVLIEDMFGSMCGSLLSTLGMTPCTRYSIANYNGSKTTIKMRWPKEFKEIFHC